jgi:hypothetical protein
VRKEGTNLLKLKTWYRILLALHIFVGIGGLAGGWAAISQPIEPLGVPMELLRHSPFQDYLIPGIILFSVIGVGNIACAVFMLFQWKYRGYSSSIVSFGLVIWIVVQCYMLRTIAFLHVLFFLIGLIKAGLSMSILLEKKQFPMNLFVDSTVFRLMAAKWQKTNKAGSY